MNIPSTGMVWVERMAESPETAEILENVRRDNCVPTLEGQFFTELAAKGIPRTFQEAAQNSKDVVADDEDTYLCQGNNIPPTQFGRLARLATLKGFVRMLPGDEANRLLGDLGLTFGTLETASADDVERFLSVYGEPASPYRSPLHIRGQADLAFVTDHTALPSPMPSWRDLVDQLGLRHYSFVPHGVIVHYPRTELAENSLRVPRAFDGIDYPPFRVEVDCAASRGMTAPLRVGPPRQEGVHRGCRVARNQLKVEPCQ